MSSSSKPVSQPSSSNQAVLKKSEDSIKTPELPLIVENIAGRALSDDESEPSMEALQQRRFGKSKKIEDGSPVKVVLGNGAVFQLPEAMQVSSVRSLKEFYFDPESEFSQVSQSTKDSLDSEWEKVSFSKQYRSVLQNLFVCFPPLDAEYGLYSLMSNHHAVEAWFELNSYLPNVVHKESFPKTGVFLMSLATSTLKGFVRKVESAIRTNDLSTLNQSLSEVLKASHINPFFKKMAIGYLRERVPQASGIIAANQLAKVVSSLDFTNLDTAYVLASSNYSFNLKDSLKGDQLFEQHIDSRNYHQLVKMVTAGELQTLEHQLRVVDILLDSFNDEAWEALDSFVGSLNGSHAAIFEHIKNRLNQLIQPLENYTLAEIIPTYTAERIKELQILVGGFLNQGVPTLLKWQSFVNILDFLRKLNPYLIQTLETSLKDYPNYTKLLQKLSSYTNLQTILREQVVAPQRVETAMTSLGSESILERLEHEARSFKFTSISTDMQSIGSFLVIEAVEANDLSSLLGALFDSDDIQFKRFLISKYFLECPYAKNNLRPLIEDPQMQPIFLTLLRRDEVPTRVENLASVKVMNPLNDYEPLLRTLQGVDFTGLSDEDRQMADTVLMLAQETNEYTNLLDESSRNQNLLYFMYLILRVLQKHKNPEAKAALGFLEKNGVLATLS